MGRPPGSRNKPKDKAMSATKTAPRTTERVAERAQSKGEIAVFSPPRLPYHDRIEEAFGIDKGTWKVLVEAIFPAAKTVDAIAMALSYCKARHLDVLKRPVHIVPMWDSARGAYVETVWPGISELRTTASRTKGYAGCDEAEFGPVKTHVFKGRVKRNSQWVEETAEVEYPEWCRITVYRVVDGQRCKFVGPKVSWLETYATQGNTDLPNKMWQERPEGQLEKCAEAAALRRAFPEEIGNELTAEEMIGRNVHDISVDIPQVATEQPAAADRDQAPPRALPPAEEKPIDPEQARDGTPPRRTTKPAEPKEDPISSGPPRATKPAPKAPEPFRVPGTGHSFDSWADQYIDLIKTSPDTATAYKWIDVNTKPFGDPPQPGPLDRLAKGKPSTYARVKKATEETMETLRDAQRKAEEKAAKQAAKAAPPPSEMENDLPSDMDEPTGEMDKPMDEPPLSEDELTGGGDGPPPRHGQSVTSSSQITPPNPEDVLKWIEETLAAVDAPEDLENIWNEQIEPKMDSMFPPDQDEARGIYRKHEKRLEP